MSDFSEYPKIYGPYRRATAGPDRNKVIFGDWSTPEFEYLWNSAWWWTEKVDGTNIRVYWDGHKVEFGGRTGNAQIPAKLITRLLDLFPEELFEQEFQDTPVTLYGEGFGASIQKGGGRYNTTGVDFVLFDVRIGGFWLTPGNVEDVAAKLSLSTVPVILIGTPHAAIETVARGLASIWGLMPDNKPFLAEGLVGKPLPGLLDRAGRRIAMKVKTVDFHTPPALPAVNQAEAA